MRGRLTLDEIGIGGGGSMFGPCLTNAAFLTKSVSETGIANKLALPDAVTKSNALYLTAKSESIFLNDVLMYISKLEIRHSADNAAWSVWETGDVAIANLFNINEQTRTFTLCDGLIQYVSDIIFYTNIEGVDTPFLKWINSSNSNEVDYTIISESEWAGLVPFNDLSVNINLDADINF